MPLIASIPLLTVYYVTYGRTDVLGPIPLRPLLGFLYYVYLACLCIFTTNGINLLAGVSGVEGSQSLIIALSLVLNDVFRLYLTPAEKEAHLNFLYF